MSLLLPLLILCGGHVLAADPPAEKLSPEVLDQKMEQTIHQPKFAWRMPRQPQAGEEKPNFAVKFLRQLLRTAGRWISALAEWLSKIMRVNPDRISEVGQTPEAFLRGSLYVLVPMIIGVGLYLLWRSRKRAPALVQAMPEVAAIDLGVAEVSPALLEEDGWLALARDYLEKGEPLMALRAYYLAGLAFLGQKQLVMPNAAKSNREYEAELARRARTVPELSAVFHGSVRLFELCWFGGRAVERESLDTLLRNLERMRALAK